MSNKRQRATITPAVSKALVASAGGRCCFRTNGRRCRKLLSSGKRATGKQAHIIGIRGARSNIELPYTYKQTKIEAINSFDNLMWICQEHHDEIDDPNNEDFYTVERLINMKLEHELEVAHEFGFPLDERARADAWFVYSFFSSFDIGTLYSLDFDDAYGDSDDNILQFISTLSFVLDELKPSFPIFKNRALNRKWELFSECFLIVFPNELLTNKRPCEQEVHDYLYSLERFLKLIESRFKWVRKIMVNNESEWL
ncbi:MULTISPECIES: hypothetical protein [Vibrio]|uniref:hypothetical protein n=1 Tax=Vibrio TaxID=662 RepID=UPI00216079A9|nr:MULTISPECIES: hypothetical protein [Vibrio]MCS0123017.1 hypothetical protein [Vibrio alginolyticus]MCS0181775.1 hypothetical protein [Vibrio alginolyticus]MDW1971996.1 hypothetical protein [Vibrio sp. 945]MDW3155060.1 hypothetical protein [Vibrio sp. 779(2023)]